MSKPMHFQDNFDVLCLNKEELKQSRMSVWAHEKEKGFEARVGCGHVKKSADQA